MFERITPRKRPRQVSLAEQVAWGIVGILVGSAIGCAIVNYVIAPLVYGDLV